MKKIGLTLAAVAALGVAACSGSNNEAGNNTTDLNVTETEAGTDVNVSANEAGAVDATNNALDTAGNALSDAGNVVENAAEDVSNAATNAAQ
jgi:hypothetical protein